MILAKNYETVSKFIKVMTKILWPLFFRTRCMYNCFIVFNTIVFVNAIGLQHLFSADKMGYRVSFSFLSVLYSIYRPMHGRLFVCKLKVNIDEL